MTLAYVRVVRDAEGSTNAQHNTKYWLRKQSASRQEHALPRLCLSARLALILNASSLLLHAFVMLACTQKGENAEEQMH